MTDRSRSEGSLVSLVGSLSILGNLVGSFLNESHVLSDSGHGFVGDSLSVFLHSLGDAIEVLLHGLLVLFQEFLLRLHLVSESVEAFLEPFLLGDHVGLSLGSRDEFTDGISGSGVGFASVLGVFQFIQFGEGMVLSNSSHVLSLTNLALNVLSGDSDDSGDSNN